MNRCIHNDFVEHISHRYETAQIINDISFNIHSNEVVSLLGPSGCGKTTLLRLAAGLEMPDAGEIKLDGLLGPLYGQMPMGDETIYHRTTYDYLSLEDLLTELGMKNIMKWDWRKTSHSEFDDHSQAYVPHMNKDNGTLISLNVECSK